MQAQIKDYVLSEKERKWVEDLNKVIAEKLSKDSFRVHSIANILKISRTKLFTKVKKLTGNTPANLLRNARLEKAHQLILTEPNLSIIEVMAKVGLNDVNHFAEIFKEYFGILPSELKKNKNEVKVN